MAPGPIGSPERRKRRGKREEKEKQLCQKPINLLKGKEPSVFQPSALLSNRIELTVIFQWSIGASLTA